MTSPVTSIMTSIVKGHNTSTRKSPDTSLVTSPHISQVTTPNTSQLNSPPTSMVTSPDTSLVTSPHTLTVTQSPDISIVTSPHIAPVTLSNKSPMTSPHTTQVTSPDTYLEASKTTSLLNSPSTISASVHYADPPLYVKSASLYGRLGNQMFMYASLVGIARIQNRIPCVDDGRLITNAFNISFIHRIDSTGWTAISLSRYGFFDKSFMNLPKVNVTISGYFQSWKYFVYVKNDIRREFTFLPSIQEKTANFYRRLRKTNEDTIFIGVHVRRTDFVKNKNIVRGYGVPKRSYFIKAFDYMRNILSNNTMFLVASDDMEWCRQNLNDTDVKLLEPDSAQNHMSILSSSDHVIISSGTFGWWCAWLTKGLTIYFKGYPSPGSQIGVDLNRADYYLPGWVGLDN
ncbi:galactoside alpha-(1,2)-fucosyltransferase 2-like [Physella acuta]|uniref:galactoside alpha-(1,2)-fucosyltransferase 2-like n=1 Tax=Physella acuta TaxID=109671 RepID=UPI0027DC4AE0|nr:galactoside alpha-(1,2)-fucosyltransferase 2-like [Physella acuta]